MLTVDQLSVFGRQSWTFFNEQLANEGGYRLYVAYYVALVGLGLASFALNRRRFSPGRFLVFAVAALLWGAACLVAAVVRGRASPRPSP